jgi:hypothetical protein
MTDEQKIRTLEQKVSGLEKDLKETAKKSDIRKEALTSGGGDGLATTAYVDEKTKPKEAPLVGYDPVASSNFSWTGSAMGTFTSFGVGSIANATLGTLISASILPTLFSGSEIMVKFLERKGFYRNKYGFIWKESAAAQTERANTLHARDNIRTIEAHVNDLLAKFTGSGEVVTLRNTVRGHTDDLGSTGRIGRLVPVVDRLARELPAGGRHTRLPSDVDALTDRARRTQTAASSARGVTGTGRRRQDRDIDTLRRQVELLVNALV